ncbi:hypothetical protein VdG2_00570 [Verticillium dahliae VDG2]|nr:hypothetical protein VdG2_00570 [Verticillium dahliae VDG2]
MLATPWICRSCIRALAKPRSPPLAFFRRASTDASASLPPALLQRARKLRAEHDQLEVSQSENFDPKTARRIGELSSVVSALSDWEAAQSSVTELTTLLSSPDAELRQLASEELSTTQTQLSTLSRQLSVSLTPKDPFAHMPCLLEIRPGPGGLESRFFADSVFKMYKQYCAYMGYRAVALKYEMADGAGSASTSAGEEPLQEAAREEQAARLRDNVLAKHKITRGDKIRTYNYSQDRCTDHRSGVDVHNLPDVLVGGESLHRIVDSARTWLATSDIAAMMAEEESKAAAAQGGQAAGKSKK